MWRYIISEITEKEGIVRFKVLTVNTKIDAVSVYGLPLLKTPSVWYEGQAKQAFDLTPKYLKNQPGLLLFTMNNIIWG